MKKRVGFIKEFDHFSYISEFLLHYPYRNNLSFEVSSLEPFFSPDSLLLSCSLLSSPPHLEQSSYSPISISAIPRCPINNFCREPFLLAFHLSNIALSGSYLSSGWTCPSLGDRKRCTHLDYHLTPLQAASRSFPGIPP